MSPSGAARARRSALLAALVWVLAGLGALPFASGPLALAAGASQAPAPDDAPDPELPGAGTSSAPTSVQAAPTPPVPPTPPAPDSALPPSGSRASSAEPDDAAYAEQDDVPSPVPGSPPARGPPAATG